MAVVRGKLEFQNVVIMHTKSKYGDWQDQAQQFRAFLVKNDIFITGPVIVQWELQEDESKEADLTIYLPTYQKLQIEENDTFSYQERLLIEDGLKIRHADMENDITATEALLEIMAEKAELKLQKPYYYIYLPVFQEYIVDIYAAIEEGEQP
ncbi:MAG: DUF5085 family protein [Lachnospiraceae bacterium]|nr:DUF5085 family protein [Lachnospiraceae bacterium]